MAIDVNHCLTFLQNDPAVDRWNRMVSQQHRNREYPDTSQPLARGRV